MFSLAGIFAYLNYLVPAKRKEILDILVNGLKRMEYRGYDSAGMSRSLFLAHNYLSFRCVSMFSLYLTDLIHSNLTDLIFFPGVGFEGTNTKNGSHELKTIKQKGKVARLQEEIDRKQWICVIASDIISSPMFCILFSLHLQIFIVIHQSSWNGTFCLCVETTDLDFEKEYETHIGIAHTRWATHGEPSPTNSHPQRSDTTNGQFQHSTPTLICSHQNVLHTSYSTLILWNNMTIFFFCRISRCTQWHYHKLQRFEIIPCKSTWYMYISMHATESNFRCTSFRDIETLMLQCVLSSCMTDV